MNARPLAAMCCMTLFVIASTAKANWQYTTWEMTASQVLSASNGTAVPLNDKERSDYSVADGSDVPELKAPYRSGSYEFDAIFSFDSASKRLSAVTLKLKDATRGHGLIGDLRAKYGKPEAEKSDPVLTYATWYNGGDQISVVMIGETMVTVKYTPRKTADNEGL